MDRILIMSRYRSLHDTVSAMFTVTFPAAQCHLPLTSAKLTLLAVINLSQVDTQPHLNSESNP